MFALNYLFFFRTSFRLPLAKTSRVEVKIALNCFLIFTVNKDKLFFFFEQQRKKWISELLFLTISLWIPLPYFRGQRSTLIEVSNAHLVQVMLKFSIIWPKLTMWQKINLQWFKMIIKNYLKNCALDCTKYELMLYATFSWKMCTMKNFLIHFFKNL